MYICIKYIPYIIIYIFTRIKVESGSGEKFPDPHHWDLDQFTISFYILAMQYFESDFSYY